MKNGEDVAFGVGFVIGVVVTLLTACGITSLRETNYRAEAVKAGVARWVPDERGNVTFEFVKLAEKSIAK